MLLFKLVEILVYYMLITCVLQSNVRLFLVQWCDLIKMRFFLEGTVSFVCTFFSHRPILHTVVRM